MKCVACGDHPLNYIHCDRWDCPLLVVREAIEVEIGSWRGIRFIQDEMPEDERDPPTLADFVPMATRGKAKGAMGGWPFNRMPQDDGEDERDPSPPDEDDDEIAADWDENGSWPSENDETEEDEEEDE